MTDKLLLLTISSLPLYVIRFQIAGFPTTLLEVLIVMTSISWVVVQFRTFDATAVLKEALKSPTGQAAAVWIAVASLSVWFSSDWLSSLGIYRAYFLEAVWLGFLITARFSNRVHLPVLALILSGWLVALPALGQAVTQTAFFTEAAHELSQGRVSGFYNSANALALYLGPLLALLPALIWQEKHRPKQSFWVLSLVIFLGVFAATRSLGGYLAIGAVLGLQALVYLWRQRPRMSSWLLKFGTAWVLLLAVAFFYILINISTFTPKVGLIYPRPLANTAQVRLCLWEGTGQLLADRPLQGSGLNGFPQIYEDYRTCDTELLQYPHNFFLNFWTETGLLGLLGIVALLGIFYWQVVTSKIPLYWKAGLLGVLLVFYLHGLVDVSYFKNDLSVQFWVIVAVGMLLLKKAQSDQR